MRFRRFVIGASAGVAVLAFAAPASAHGGHRSCGDGARAYVVAQAHEGIAGEVASLQATSGNLAEGVLLAHSLLCEPAP